METEAAEYPLEVMPHGAGAQPQPLSDRVIGEAFGREERDLRLAAPQSKVTRSSLVVGSSGPSLSIMTSTPASGSRSPAGTHFAISRSSARTILAPQSSRAANRWRCTRPDGDEVEQTVRLAPPPAIHSSVRSVRL